MGVTGVVVVGLVAAVALVAVTALGDDGFDHPDEWDPRVVDFVAFVEQERGLEFEHPVHVDFLTAEEYSDHMRTDEADFTDEELEEFDQSVAMLRSLGLASGSFDLLAATNDLVDDGTLAVYSFEDHRIRVRGTEVDVNLEVTLVHELVHALQDQHFDLSRMAGFETSGESAAFRAVVEGDATAVEQRYVDALSGEELEEYEATSAAAQDELDFDDVPEVLVALFGAPYALGAPMIELALAEDGWRAVNRLLEDPPTTELELLDPQRALSGFERVDVETPEPDAGEEIQDEGDFGALTLYLVLASRVDPLAALEAADGWAGDAYIVTTDDDGRVCTTVATRARDTAATDRLEAALDGWASGVSTATDATVSLDGAVITFRSCDPGEDVESGIVTDGLASLSLPATRSFLQATFRSQGIEADAASCMVGEVLGGVPLELLSDPDPDDAEIARFQELMLASMRSCS